MMRGTIVSLTPIPLLPSFLYASTYNPTFLRLYAKHLGTLGFTIPYEDQDGAYQRYTGDTSVPGKGEILVWKPRPLNGMTGDDAEPSLRAAGRADRGHVCRGVRHARRAGVDHRQSPAGRGRRPSR